MLSHRKVTGEGSEGGVYNCQKRACFNHGHAEAMQNGINIRCAPLSASGKDVSMNTRNLYIAFNTCGSYLILSLCRRKVLPVIGVLASNWSILPNGTNNAFSNRRLSFPKWNDQPTEQKDQHEVALLAKE